MQRRQPVQMLNLNHLHQQHGGHTGAAVILVVQRLHHLMQPLSFNRRVDLTQQMILRYQTFSILHEPSSILSDTNRKAQKKLDLFDRLRAPVKKRQVPLTFGSN